MVYTEPKISTFTGLPARHTECKHFIVTAPLSVLYFFFLIWVFCNPRYKRRHLEKTLKVV